MRIEKQNITTNNHVITTNALNVCVDERKSSGIKGNHFLLCSHCLLARCLSQVAQTMCDKNRMQATKKCAETAPVVTYLDQASHENCRMAGAVKSLIIELLIHA